MTDGVVHDLFRRWDAPVRNLRAHASLAAAVTPPVTLFSHAGARDFADVYALVQRFNRTTLLQRAHEVDPGFDRVVLAEMMGALDRSVDDELPIGSAGRDCRAHLLRRLSTGAGDG